ncbi:MAG TPA: OsmC family protein, partial [Thermodesulfovibrionia bacterium]|nr:OsmC family protein [Thermodesulfovibrionia bacterium]
MSQQQDTEVESLENELSGYKEKILPVNKSFLKWERDLYFVGRTQRGYEVEYDIKYEEGCSPTETLLLSVGGCLAIDVVSFLTKMRCEITSFKMALEGTRNPT